MVNKTASIATEFRTFPHEVLAGVDDLVVELKEGGSKFKLDFAKVGEKETGDRVPSFFKLPTLFLMGAAHGCLDIAMGFNGSWFVAA